MVPLPEGATVRSFTFSGGAKEPTAELLAKDAAMTTYKSIVAKMKDPAILEFAGCNLVRSSVFPIEPNGTQKLHGVPLVLVTWLTVVNVEPLPALSTMRWLLASRRVNPPGDRMPSPKLSNTRRS